MRLLALCADRGVPVDGSKGATVHLLELWRALARQGARVTGLAPWRGGALPADGPRLRIVSVGTNGQGDHEVASRLRNEALDRVRRDPPEGLIERLALGSTLGVELRQRTGAPLMVEVNAPLDRESARFRTPPSASEVDAVRNTLHAADHVYCVSRPLIAWAEALGARPGHVELLANGVDVSAFGTPMRPARGERRKKDPGRGLRVGFVGSFKPWHGVEYLIEAAARVVGRGVPLRLELMGEGPERGSHENEVRALGLTAHVTFLGARPHDQVPAFLESLDVAVAPAASSGDYYFSPLKLFEYAAAGRAIIAPAAGQVPEWFEHGIDAWLVPPGDPAALAGAIERLSDDPALRLRLGASARARAEREFDWSRVADRILGWLREAREATADSAVGAKGEHG